MPLSQSAAPTRLDLALRNQGEPHHFTRDGTGYRLDHVITPAGAAYDFSWDGARAYLAWHDIVLDDGEMRGDDLAPVRGRDLRDRLTSLPQGMRVEGWSAPRARANAFTALYFDEDWLSKQLECENAQVRPEIYFVHERLGGIMRHITATLRQASAPRALCDSLALVAASALVGRADEAIKGALTPHQLDAANAFIEAHLHEDVGLDQIAGAAGLSSFHFARAYKRSTGKTPYRHLLERRVARAQFLLAATNQPLAEIARASGFGRASHFSRGFAAIAGQTPSAFRRAAR
ncbi:MAG: AraC family transcriptional regulator [Hyphomonadaceae bacterium JAD_PAG50586_4]|nr:MAG: AraC family transcriptional regulator [Hyphomonadaceae bacterium JAD_PAG50586_4]